MMDAKRQSVLFAWIIIHVKAGHLLVTFRLAFFEDAIACPGPLPQSHNITSSHPTTRAQRTRKHKLHSTLS